jgi:hypothetical protein
MCTYLYAAFSLKNGIDEGLSTVEADATARWRRAIQQVAIEEMGHLTAVWNITAALGGSPRFGRMNFPLDPGGLPASVVVRLAPFGEAVLQHFIFLSGPAIPASPMAKDLRPTSASRGAWLRRGSHPCPSTTRRSVLFTRLSRRTSADS